MAVHDHVLPAVRDGRRRNARRPEARRDRLPDVVAAARRCSPAPPDPPATRRRRTNIANLTGFPDLIVPAGFTSDALPVGISFFGPAFSEPKLLALGYAFEQATKARRLAAPYAGAAG